MYRIAYSSSVADDLKALGAPERSHILDEIDVQLIHEPLRGTRNRKILVGLVPPWEHVPPDLGIEDRRVSSVLRCG